MIIYQKMIIYSVIITFLTELFILFNSITQMNGDSQQ